MTIVLVGTFRFPLEKMPQAREHLRVLSDITYRDENCGTFVFGEDLFEPGLVHITEIWPDSETLQKHYTSAHIKDWVEISGSLGLSDSKFTVFDGQITHSV